MENQTNESRSTCLEDGINECNSLIRWHRMNSMMVLVLMVFCAAAFYFAFRSYEVTMDSAYHLSAELGKDWINRSIQLYFVFFGVFALTFGSLVALYRYHLKETARNEQLKIGFRRIHIAAENKDKGFQSEVRVALTENAFSYDVKKDKSKEIESPLPGHPASEIITAVLNKVFENVDIEVRKKP